ncbi:MAG: hypothetical protein GFH27_549323n17 [Chloroflexi bacterium AL-W]|nr:hypothetical protein [Chloroflexi bacterium AL-N1]NOK70168.1 hypothetical protein [Chloroflexi bacterium AL-N10]NOK77705.1 hypothetical protein [Chloroflexi bacterium AL-N5]NOK84714.1 hypothetical protein [Chloroflexi bacterium AL-W]NOK93223.1 hypothetical protein [Chloroflexi bacterium AL-N15]
MPDRPDIFYNCSNVELRTRSIDLNRVDPLGYVIICSPIPSICFDAFTGDGSGADLDTVWRYSEAILNSDSSALGPGGVVGIHADIPSCMKLGHAVGSLAHRSETDAVMRQGKLTNIVPIQVEIDLMDAKYQVFCGVL